MFKLPAYVILIVGLVVVPILEKVAAGLEAKAKETPEDWDDILYGSFKAVIEFFKQPQVFIPK